MIQKKSTEKDWLKNQSKKVQMIRKNITHLLIWWHVRRRRPATSPVAALERRTTGVSVRLDGSVVHGRQHGGGRGVRECGARRCDGSLAADASAVRAMERSGVGASKGKWARKRNKASGGHQENFHVEINKGATTRGSRHPWLSPHYHFHVSAGNKHRIRSTCCKAASFLFPLRPRHCSDCRLNSTARYPVETGSHSVTPQTA